MWTLFESDGRMYRIKLETGETWCLEYCVWVRVVEKTKERAA